MSRGVPTVRTWRISLAHMTHLPCAHDAIPVRTWRKSCVHMTHFPCTHDALPPTCIPLVTCAIYEQFIYWLHYTSVLCYTSTIWLHYTTVFLHILLHNLNINDLNISITKHFKVSGKQKHLTPTLLIYCIFPKILKMISLLTIITSPLLNNFVYLFCK